MHKVCELEADHFGGPLFLCPETGKVQYVVVYF